jgi:hypothetical protein
MILVKNLLHKYLIPPAHAPASVLHEVNSFMLTKFHSVLWALPSLRHCANLVIIQSNTISFNYFKFILLFYLLLSPQASIPIMTSDIIMGNYSSTKMIAAQWCREIVPLQQIITWFLKNQIHQRLGR